MKLIDLYKEWMENGLLPHPGLCNSIPKEYKATFKLLKPSVDEREQLQNERLAYTYWGSGLSFLNKGRVKRFTPLRQTIVLLICAMNDEI